MAQSRAELDRLQRQLNDLYSLDRGPARVPGGAPSPMAAPMPGAGPEMIEPVFDRVPETPVRRALAPRKTMKAGKKQR